MWWRLPNVVALAAVLTLFALRSSQVGPVEALAEAIGVASFDTYTQWRDRYSPLHATLFDGTILAEWLEPALAAALANETGRAAALRSLAKAEGVGVFSLRVLSPAFCAMLLEELHHYNATMGGAGRAPNDMHEQGILLEEAGLKPLMDQLNELVLSPLAAALYAEGAGLPAASKSLGALVSAPLGKWGGVGAGGRGHAELEVEASLAAAASNATGCCAAQHSFAVGYAADAQAGLDMHHDDSDVTMNVCLAAEDTALVEGSLTFCGFVGWPLHRKHALTVTHEVGRAVVHLGLHRHGATALSAGSRHNLIMWGRTESARPEDSCVPPGGGSADTASLFPAGQSRARDTWAAGTSAPRRERRRRTTRLHAAEAAPDLRCLSWTHDSDFEQYLALPPQALRKRERERETRELLELVSVVTEAQILKLPQSYQPIVRVLKQMQNASGRAS